MAAENSVLFICLGNICRSPIAEAVFTKLLNEKNLANKWKVDSAAIGSWHVGSRPDSRALSVLKSANFDTDHRARKIKKNDFYNFKYILGMDHDNMADLKRLAPSDSTANLELLGKYDPAGELIIEDPYYLQGEYAFHKTLEHCIRACTGFLKAVETE